MVLDLFFLPLAKKILPFAFFPEILGKSQTIHFCHNLYTRRPQVLKDYGDNLKDFTEGLEEPVLVDSWANLKIQACASMLRV